MAARVMPEQTHGARVLPFERRGRAARPAPGPRVVAVILDDGTVRELAHDGRPRPEPFQSGQLSGDRWILWWERRDFD
ncbi:MAG TPA: hypothetical protein VHL78_05765 [Actinomycetota bacterium]|nr:hypothetical protein [Actinomycetota bacterium]